MSATAVPVRAWMAAFFLGSVLVRLVYVAFGRQDGLFVGWYIDGFHHWQIAYLTREIGVSQGMRLWDLGGVEYFWGLIPTVLDALLLAATGSSELWPLQALNVVAGSASVAVLYLIGRRYWSHAAGVFLALFFAVNPVSVLTDASAMQEPVAFLFLVAALSWALERPRLAGLMLGLAAASRPDYWAYSLAILGGTALAIRAIGRRPPFVDLARMRPYLIGYLVVMVPFVWYLWAQTGNPVYPLYWNFLGNAQGQWHPAVEPSAHQRDAQAVARGILAAAAVGLPLVLWRRPRGWPVWMTGLLGAALIGYMLGISRYVVSYLDRFWLDRIMLLLYLLVAALVAVALARVVRSLPRWRPLGTAALAVSLAIALETSWPLVLGYQDAVGSYGDDAALGARIAALAEEGTVIVPGDAVVVTYSLVQHGVRADRLLSGLYHPEYAPGSRDELVAWLRRYDVRWLAVRRGNAFYETVVAHEPAVFELVLAGVLDVYRVSP